jgi:hypothetical protein
VCRKILAVVAFAEQVGPNVTKECQEPIVRMPPKLAGILGVPEAQPHEASTWNEVAMRGCGGAIDIHIRVEGRVEGYQDLDSALFEPAEKYID